MLISPNSPLKSRSISMHSFRNKQLTLGFRHHLIVVYKTAFYSFYLPVALAMRMVRRLPVNLLLPALALIIAAYFAFYQVGVTDEAAYELALSILLPLGEYFQVQDDYLDCYASPEVLGKIGTDILVSRVFNCFSYRTT